MKNLKKIVNENIEKAINRKNVHLENTPNDLSAIRYWDGYIIALQSIVNLLPDDDPEYVSE